MTDLPKPRITLNRHRHAPYIWRCHLGRCNGYADTLAKAYDAWLRSYRRAQARDAERKARKAGL